MTDRVMLEKREIRELFLAYSKAGSEDEKAS